MLFTIKYEDNKITVIHDGSLYGKPVYDYGIYSELISDNIKYQIHKDCKSAIESMRESK
jgi:hypothetical protein